MKNKLFKRILVPCFCLPLCAYAVATEQQLAPIQQECERQWRMPAFDPIRDKVDLLPNAQGAAAYLFNQQKATSAEKNAIKKMAVLLDNCQSQLAAVTYRYDSRRALRENKQKVADLENLMQVHDGKITWGEFTRRRYALVVESQAVEQEEREQLQREAEARRRENEARQREEKARQRESEALQRENEEARQRERETEKKQQREAARKHMAELQHHYQALAILRRGNANTSTLMERVKVDPDLFRYDYEKFFRNLRKGGYIIDYKCKYKHPEYECKVYY